MFCLAMRQRIEPTFVWVPVGIGMVNVAALFKKCYLT